MSLQGYKAHNKNGRAYKLVRAHFHNLFTNYLA